MTFWTAIVAIVAIGCLTDVLRARVRQGGQKPNPVSDELSERLARLEERTTNLETIVLEREQDRRYAEVETG